MKVFYKQQSVSELTPSSLVAQETNLQSCADDDSNLYHSDYRQAKFAESLFAHWKFQPSTTTINETFVRVRICAEQCVLLLEHAPKVKQTQIFNKFDFVLPVGNAPMCPLQHTPAATLQMLSQTSKYPLAVAACVVLEVLSTGGCDAHGPRRQILVTRRAKHMRTFPSLFVLPGGGYDDSLDQGSPWKTALREIKEEVGLSFLTEDHLEPLCCWESCSPHAYESEHHFPRRHHFVIYFKATVSQEILNKHKIKVQYEEVDAICWVHDQVVTRDEKDEEKIFPAMVYTTNEKHELISEQATHFSKCELYSNTPHGTRFALRKWVEQLPLLSNM